MHIGVAFWSTAVTADDQAWIEALLNNFSNLDEHYTLTVISDGGATLSLPESIKQLPVPLISGFFGLQRWFGKTLPKLVQQEKIEALLLINGCPAKVSVPQLPVFLSPSMALKACNTQLRFLYKRLLAKRLQIIDKVGLISKLKLPEFQRLYSLPESRVLAIGYAVPAAYQPASDWQLREQFLQKQTGGKEYFLCISHLSENRLLHLLKAFSLFKKRQQSNMQLLVTGAVEPTTKLQEKLDTYKYRQDVQLLSHPAETVFYQLTAGAYAMLFMEENAATAYPVAAAMQCHIPVIGFESNEALREIAGPAALYTDASVESLAEQMKLVYKDESLRQRLVYEAQLQAQRVNGREAVKTIITRLQTTR